jgi:hypothetical protein
MAVCLALATANTLFAQPPAAPPAAPAAAAPAPQYVELKVDEKTTDRLNRLGSGTIGRILRGSEEFSVQNKQVLTDYYTKLIFTRMTQVDKLDELLESRDKLNEDFERCRTDRTKEVRDYLNSLTTEVMFGIVYGPRKAVALDGREAIVCVRPPNGDMKAGVRFFALDGKEIPANAISKTIASKEDFHPAVKYNAMLILGSLNNEVGLGGKDPVPRVEVLRPLLANIARNPNAPDYLRVGALLGIARHVEIIGSDLEVGIQGLIADTMLRIVNEPFVIGREDGQVWLKQQAVDILGMLGFLGDDGSVVEEMAKVIADANQPLPLRYATASAIGQMKLASPPKMGADNLVKQLGQLAADACREELYLAQTRNQKLSRSRVLGRLKSVLTGVDGAGGEKGGTGVAAVLNASQASFAQKLRDQIGVVWDSVVAATSEKELEAKLTAGAKGLEGLLAASAPAAAAAAPGVADDPLPALDGQPKAGQPKAAEPQEKPKSALPF